MKILAAQRLLVVADADEQLSRDFLKEVAGIAVGRKMHSQPDRIVFEITEKQISRAHQQLTRYFGTPKSDSNVVRYYGDTWYTDASKKRYIKVAPAYRKGPTDTGYLIEIGDTAHTETRDEFLKRILNPSYNKRL